MQRTGVLFMQSQEFLGADSQVHISLMRHLPRDRYAVHCAAPAERGGAKSAPLRALEQLGDVHVRPTRFGPSLESTDRVAIARQVVRGGFETVRSLAGLVRYIRKHNIRIVHCTEKPRDAVYGTIVARLSGARCVIHVHVKAELWIRPVVRRAMGRAAALVGVSNFVADSLRELGYEESRIHAVPNGLEVDEWTSNPSDRESVRREFGVEDDRLVIVSASRLFRYKGQHELLAALPEVKRIAPNFKLLIVGSDDARSFRGEASYSAVLHQLCDDLQLWDDVVFTGWRSDVRRLMAGGDLYCMPSFEEPFGMVFIEAMALGKPVVALNSGGCAEIVVNHRTGLLSEPGDVDALARNLVAVLTDPKLRDSMGSEGRMRVDREYRAELMAGRMAHVYDCVLEQA